MYRMWSPFEHDLEHYPGLDLKINSRHISVVVSYWRAKHCFYAFELSFKNALVNLQIIDESNYLYDAENWPNDDEFDKDKLVVSPIWVEKNSKRIKQYQDLKHDIKFYSSIDSYYIVGQSIIVLLDVETVKPRVKLLDPKVLNLK